MDALTEMSQVYTWKSTKKLRIGLAKDEAFCFFYEDNLDLLRYMGAELVAFYQKIWTDFFSMVDIRN